ncbi:MAG: tetratricopeptide repeat protein, partial [Bacteroidota bacterium]
MYLQDALRPPPMSPGICLLLLLTFTSCLHAQSLTVDDSSWQYQPVDSLKVDLLLELAKQNRYAAPDSARFFCQQALRISMQKSLLSREMLSLNQLGILSKNARQFAEAVAFYTQGLALARELAIPKRQASFLNNLGNVYHRWNKMDSALQAYQESLEVKKRLGDYRGMAKSFNNLGNFYASREEHNRSKAYFSRSLELVMEYGEEKDQARTSLNLGNAFFKLENYDSAAYCYEQAYEFFAAESYPREAALCLHNLAGIEEKKGRFPTALRLYQQCLQQHIALGDTVSQVNTLQNIGNLYKEQAQYEAAITIFEMALAHAERQQLPDRLRMLNFQLSTCYEEIGQAQLALQHHKQYLVWHDSIYNVRQDALVLEVKTKYETEQRTQHLQLAQAENKLKQERINKLIGFAVLLVVLLGVGARAYLQKRRAHQTLQVQKNLVSRQKQEKALLLRELHHRVTNNLQLISSVL